ncbi:MAG TPA: glycosyltransferase [Chloroflexota bacterium]|nr:glycosyltransferase [Chloroflexota bacterium]
MSRRIALISEHASPLGAVGGIDGGGQNVYVGQVARHLAARGWDVDVFTRRDAETLPEIVHWQPGIRVIHVAAGPPCFVPKEQMLPFMAEFTAVVLTEAQRRPYDLLHANFWMSGLVAADVKEALGIPFVVTFHALGKVRRMHQGDDDRSPPERIAIEARVVAEADQIIAECPRDEEDLVSLYGAAPAKITIVPCGFDPTELGPIDRRVARLTLGLPTDEPIVLQLGRMVPRKGVDTAIEAFAQLVDHHEWSGGRLLIVGGESETPDPALTPELGRLMTLARTLGIDDRVSFVGRRGRADLRTYYSAADVFVTTPWYEPFGITPVEAMACGTPVVGADVGGIRFSVLDGETGYLAPPRDPVAVAERIARIVADPALHARLSRQAIARAERLFTWEKVTASLETVYREALRQRPAVSAVGSTGGAYLGPAATPPTAVVDAGFEGAVAALQATRQALGARIVDTAATLTECFARGGRLLVCGNGGSAAEAQHFAAEFVGRLRPPAREALPALALTADTVTLTAWANDAGFDEVFARQVAAFGNAGDVLVAISTSGRSPNIVLALQEARRRGLRTIALVGGDGGAAGEYADTVLAVPSDDTQHIQEVHLVMLHLVADLVDRAWRRREDPGSPQLATAAIGPAATPVVVSVGAIAEGPGREPHDADGVFQLTGNGHARSSR